MDTWRHAQLEMLNVLDTFLTEWLTFIGSVSPAAVDVVNSFKDKLEEIRQTNAEVNKELSGIRAQNVTDKATLAQGCKLLAYQLYSYAKKVGNPDLALQMKKSYWYFFNKRDGDLPPIAQSLHDLALGIVNLIPNPLEPYSITPDWLANFQTRIDGYKAAVPKPKSAINNRKAKNESLDELIKQAVEILHDRLDPVMYQFTFIDKGFYKKYRNAEKVVDPYTVRSGFRGAITDANTGASLVGIATGKAENTATKYLATFNPEAGQWKILTPKNRAFYNLTFEAPGYETFTLEHKKPTKGEKIVINVKMKPIS